MPSTALASHKRLTRKLSPDDDCASDELAHNGAPRIRHDRLLEQLRREHGPPASREISVPRGAHDRHPQWRQWRRRHGARAPGSPSRPFRPTASRSARSILACLGAVSTANPAANAAASAARGRLRFLHYHGAPGRRLLRAHCLSHLIIGKQAVVSTRWTCRSGLPRPDRGRSSLRYLPGWRLSRSR